MYKIPWIAFLMAVNAIAVDFNDKVVASVNKSVITERQLERKIQELKILISSPNGPTKGRQMPEPALRQKALDDLVDEELVLQHSGENLNDDIARRYAAKYVESLIEDIQKQVGAKKFNEELARENMTLEDYKTNQVNLRVRQIMIQQSRESWIDEYMLKPVSKAQIDRYVEENPDVAESGASPVVQFVFLKIPNEKDEASLNAVKLKAEKILSKARIGDAFEKLVAQYSQNEKTKNKNGAMELINRTTPYPEFGPLFDLQKNQIYPEVIRIPGWFCVAKVIEKEDLNNIVRRRIATDQQSKALEEKRKESHIQIDRSYFPVQE